MSNKKNKNRVISLIVAALGLSSAGCGVGSAILDVDGNPELATEEECVIEAPDLQPVCSEGAPLLSPGKQGYDRVTCVNEKDEPIGHPSFEGTGVDPLTCETRGYIKSGFVPSPLCDANGCVPQPPTTRGVCCDLGDYLK